MLDDIPARAKKFSGESIRAWRLARRELFDRLPNFIRGERSLELTQKKGRVTDGLQIKRDSASFLKSEDGGEVIERGARKVDLTRNPRPIDGEVDDRVLLCTV